MPCDRFVLVLGMVLAGLSTAEAQTAADAHNDPQAMQQARDALQHEAGGLTNYFFQVNRLEVQSNEGTGLMLWEGRGWVGGDYQRLWVKTEAEYSEGGKVDEAEIQGLYSRAISPFFDVQAGVRQDLAPGARRTFGVVGIQGLAPYWFEVDAALFVSHEGDVSGRFELEYDLRFTQRLILQPRVELNFAIQNVEKAAVGSGLSTAETGARLRYEFKREIAPYLGISWTAATGRTADFLRREGENPNRLSVVAGLRLWF